MLRGDFAGSFNCFDKQLSRGPDSETTKQSSRSATSGGRVEDKDVYLRGAWREDLPGRRVAQRDRRIMEPLPTKCS
jgi:hypothetical protein